MNELHDLLLNPPISSWLLDLLLFIAFTLHFIFVLLLIGTAILSVYYFMATWIRGYSDELPWFKEILKTFLAHKSIAVVLGVAALLLIQVGYTVPFFMGISIFPGFWIMIIIFLIISFLSFDILGHKVETYSNFKLAGGVISLFFLLIVPAIFVAVLSTAEESTHWIDIIKNNNQLFGSLTTHWLFRYLHVIGAAIILGAAFHYFFSTRDEKLKKEQMIKWIILGIFFQVIVGILLFSTVLNKFDFRTYVLMLLGVLSALIFLWMVIEKYSKEKSLDSRIVVFLLLLVLLPMLLTRQDLQFKGFKPVIAELEFNQKYAEAKTIPFYQQALKQYENKIETVYDSGEKIYLNSCAFCHGKLGNGDGSETQYLKIPPEKISMVKMDRDYLYEHLEHGVAGTGMPYFTFYLNNELDDLMDYLQDKFDITGNVKTVANVSSSSKEETLKIFKETCSTCHGENFNGETKLSKGFTPHPPDFNKFSLSTDRAFDVITNGYNGTMMYPYNKLSKEVRLGLVQLIQEQRNKK